MKNRRRNIVSLLSFIIAWALVWVLSVPAFASNAKWDGKSTNGTTGAYYGGVYAFRWDSEDNESGISWTTDPWDTTIDTHWNEIITNRDPKSDTNAISIPIGKHAYFGYPKYVYIEKWIWGTEGLCIHQGSNWHGVTHSTIHCSQNYQNRYIGVCADCMQNATCFVTGSKTTLSNVYKFINGSTYYYLCPINGHKNIRDGHMEQGAEIKHKCKALSYNRYAVEYEVNAPTGATVLANSYVKDGKYIPDEWYYYDNATEYEGKTVNPKTTLNSASTKDLAVSGYAFTGWYTKATGGVKVSSWLELQKESTASLRNNENHIKVYAHWEKCNGTLILKDECASDKKITVGYNASTSVPNGVGGKYTVKLNANGGTVSVASLNSNKVFDYWQKVSPFYGSYNKDTGIYTNNVPTNGMVTTLKAVYEPSEVTLPTPIRPGYEFLGWTENGTNVVGRGGDSYLTSKDITLIAKWNAINLSLQSVENYKANNGIGAVDLSWKYTGQNALTVFKTFQSEANKDGNYRLLKSTNTIASETKIDEKYTSDKTYTIPENGFYDIALYGGKGADYDTYVGGNGGYVQAKVFLKKGQVLKIYPGGEGNENEAGISSKSFGGGSGSDTNNTVGTAGGAATVVYIDNKLFAVAGGGGAAGYSGDGGPGGEREANYLTGSSAGGSGYAGGGGGYKGGIAASDEWTEDDGQNHENDLVSAHICEGSSTSGGGCYSKANANYYKSCGHNSGDLICNTTEHTHSGIGGSCYSIGCGTAAHSHTSSCNKTCTHCGGTGTIQGYYNGHSGKCPFCNGAGRSIGCGKSPHSHSNSCYRMSCPLGEHTHGTGCRHYCSGYGGSCYTYSGTTYGKSCSHSDGTTIITCKGARGGSNYLDSTATGEGYLVSGSFQNTSNSGKNAGPGYATIKSISVGYHVDNTLNGVAAPDIDGPSVPVLISKYSNEDNSSVTVEWMQGDDIGTTYYFYVQSYNMSDDSKATATSNKTYNKLTTGVAGYRYKIDDKATTTITKDNSVKVSCSDSICSKKVDLKTTDQYLHIVTFDKADNLGKQLDVNIGKLSLPEKGPENTVKAHGILSKPTLDVTNSTDDGVYVNGSKVYIKADGLTELSLKITGKMQTAYDYYRINKLVFMENSNTDSYTSVFDNRNYVANKVSTTRSGNTILTSAGNTNASISYTSGKAETITSTQRFTLGNETSLTLTPKAIVECDDCSATASEVGSGYTIIGDKTSPVETVTHSFSVSDSRNKYTKTKYMGTSENLYTYKCSAGTITVTINAKDTGSGVSSVNVYYSGMTSGTPIAKGNGCKLTVDDDGSYEYTVVVLDNVGNETIFHLQIDKDTKIPIIQDNTVDKTVPEDNHAEYIPKTPKADESIKTNQSSEEYAYVYGWTNFDVMLKYTAYDQSGITDMKLYKGWSETGTLLAKGVEEGQYSKSLNYIAKEEGISKYLLVVSDSYNHKVTIKITVKIDYTPIKISGFDLIKSLEGLDITEYSEPLNITIIGQDIAPSGVNEKSGMKDFTITITNHDNGLERIISTDSEKASAPEYVIPITSAGSTAKYTFNILEDDLIWFGNWTVNIDGTDNAWNVSTDDGSMSEFTLKASITRKFGANTYTPSGALKIRAGETVILKVETGGYADLVTVDLNELMDKGCSVYVSDTGAAASTYDPKTLIDYDPSRIKHFDKPIDYLEVSNQANGRFTIYYQLIFPIDAEDSKAGESYEISIDAYKGITYTIEADGTATIKKDGRKIKVNKAAIAGSETESLSRKLYTAIEGSVVNDYHTVFSTIK